MITALVIIAVFAIGLLTGNTIGSRTTRESMIEDFESRMEEIEAQGGEQALEELLENPDSAVAAKSAISGYVAGQQDAPLTNGYKFVKGKGPVLDTISTQQPRLLDIPDKELTDNKTV